MKRKYKFGIMELKLLFLLQDEIKIETFNKNILYAIINIHRYEK